MQISLREYPRPLSSIALQKSPAVVVWARAQSEVGCISFDALRRFMLQPGRSSKRLACGVYDRSKPIRAILPGTRGVPERE